MYGNIETCKAVIRKLIELDPTNSCAYVLKDGWMNGSKACERSHGDQGIKKVPGCSLVRWEVSSTSFLLEMILIQKAERYT